VVKNYRLTPPKTIDAGVLAEWWKKHHRDWTPPQREAVWVACDKVGFYVVRPIKSSSRVFVVVQATWRWDDDSFNADPEGGLLRYAFRSREAAEAYRQMLEEDARQNQDVKLAGTGRSAYIENHVNPKGRFPELPSDSVPLSDCPLFEVIEIEWNEDHVEN